MNNHRLHVWLCLPLSVIMTAGALSAAWGKADYYTLKSHGKPIGQVSIEHYPIASSEKGQSAGTITEIHNTNHATREGTPFALNEVSRFVENPLDGHPLSFSYAYNLGEQHLMEANGKLQGNKLAISLQRENILSHGQTPIASERFLFPGGEAMQQIYRQHFQDPKGSRFEFQTLALGLQPQIVNSEVIPGKREKLKIKHGKAQTVRQFEIKNPANPKTSFQEWRDAQGKLYKAKSAGSDDLEMVLAAVDDEARLDALDVVTASAVVSNRIAQPRITTEAVYRMSPIHGKNINWSYLPTSDRQSIQKITDNQLYLKVIQRAPKDVSVQFPLDGPTGAYLQSTPYVQSSDPEINRLAQEIVGKEKRAYFAARKLQQWVYDNITQKDLALGFASAKETLMNRQGDCTEHAVLLTALTRSLGIPSRVAVGLIYMPNGDSQAGHFVYHMWTEIYLAYPDSDNGVPLENSANSGNSISQGEWVPLDATRPEALTDATHIKLADSALSDANDLVNLTQRITDVMGRMKIDVLKAMSSAQSLLDIEAAPDITATAIQKLDLQKIDIQTLSRQSIKHFRVELPPTAMSKESPDGLFTYGVEALAKGNYDEAQTDFQKALDKLREPISLYRLGERLAGIEMYDLARQAFERAADKDHSLWALVRDWKNDYIPRQTLPDDLNQLFMQAISQPGQESNPALLKTITAQASYFAPAFRRLGEESTGADAINALQQAVALYPHDFRNQESLGDAYMQQSRYAAALKAYRAAIDALKYDTAFLQSKPEWLMNLEGKQNLAKGSMLVANDRHNTSGWIMMGQGLLQQKRREEASQAFNNALTLNPGSAEAKIQCFDLALQNADWHTIYAHKDAIAALAGSNAQAASLLGLYQMHSRQYGAAINSLQRAIAMAPGQAEAYRTLAQTYLRLADLADDVRGSQGQAQSKRWIAQAMSTLHRGSKAASTALERHSLAIQLARLQTIHGSAEIALQLANSVLAENPIDGTAWAAKGKAQFYLGQRAEARTTLATALLLNPNDADTLIQLGNVAKEEERNALALEYYQKAYKADPFNQEAANTVRHMMSQLHISGQQPSNYWYLSDDEHDYLVQLLYQGRMIGQQTLNYLRTLQAVPGRAGKIEYSANGIIAAQQLGSKLGKLKQDSLRLNRELQNNRVPARFTSLNQEMQAAVHNQLKALDSGLLMGSTLDFDAQEVSQQDYGLMLAQIIYPAKSIHQVLDQLAAHLPESVMNSLVAEAQLDDLFQLNQESAAIAQVLLSKKDKEATVSRSADSNSTKPVAKVAPATPSPQTNTATATAPSQTQGSNANATDTAPKVKIPPPNFPAPVGSNPSSGIKNISLQKGMPPSAIKTSTKPATGH